MNAFDIRLIYMCVFAAKVLQDLDLNTTVLEPTCVLPTFGVLSRRIVVERAVTMMLRIDLDNPAKVCSISLLFLR